jgi:two-component system sensor histidine kinase TctE
LSRRPAARSLTGRLLWALVGSLTIVAVVLGAGGAWLINGIVEGSADRLLGASARAIAETLAVDEGEITLDLPPFALGMLENNARDNVYYSVRHNGRLITGYPDLPTAAPAGVDLEESTFRYAEYRGARIRIAAEARRLPRINGPIVVQVAETLDARRELSRRMLAGLAILEALLVSVAGLLVWPTVKWSLRPLTRLREEMDARSQARADFKPLPMAGVPVELSALVEGFNGLLSRLEASVEGMRRFTADASHQMRTPLAILRTHLALLRKHGADSVKGRASLDDIDLATDRLQSLLTGLITLARTEDAVASESREIVDLADVARQVATEFAPLASKSRIHIELDAPETGVPSSADPVLVTELLSNLIDNAIRYNSRGGQVVVRVSSSEDASILQVDDDGAGIPEADRAAVFQRFYRLARDQHRAGSGLGLSIVQAIASRLGASLRLDAGLGGRGLSVIITVPKTG